MNFVGRDIADLVRIVAEGGSLVLEAGARPTEELLRIAEAAANSGARVDLRGLGNRPTDELVLIARTGKGAIIFTP